jgi:predicted DNA-binding protein
MYNYIHHIEAPTMHRTQIYLPEDLHNRLKTRSRTDGLSISELVRRAVEKDLQQESSISSARQFFETLKPLESFADCEPEQYVRSLRDSSRILRDEQNNSND